MAAVLSAAAVIPLPAVEAALSEAILPLPAVEVALSAVEARGVPVVAVVPSAAVAAVADTVDADNPQKPLSHRDL